MGSGNDAGLDSVAPTEQDEVLRPEAEAAVAAKSASACSSAAADVNPVAKDSAPGAAAHDDALHVQSTAPSQAAERDQLSQAAPRESKVVAVDTTTDADTSANADLAVDSTASDAAAASGVIDGVADHRASSNLSAPYTRPPQSSSQHAVAVENFDDYILAHLAELRVLQPRHLFQTFDEHECALQLVPATGAVASVALAVPTLRELCAALLVATCVCCVLHLFV